MMIGHPCHCRLGDPRGELGTHHVEDHSPEERLLLLLIGGPEIKRDVEAYYHRECSPDECKLMDPENCAPTWGASST